jgi:hypothetical protein
MYTIQNNFTFKLVSALFIKTSIMLKTLFDTNDMVMEYNCPEFSWEVDEDDSGNLTVSLGVFKNFNFIGTWNGKTDPNEIEINVNYENYDLTKDNNLDKFVQMEKLIFDILEKEIILKNNR